MGLNRQGYRIIVYIDEFQQLAEMDGYADFFRTSVPIRGEASRFQNKKNPDGRKKVEKDLEARKK